MRYMMVLIVLFFIVSSVLADEPNALLLTFSSDVTPVNTWCGGGDGSIKSNWNTHIALLWREGTTKRYSADGGPFCKSVYNTAEMDTYEESGVHYQVDIERNFSSYLGCYLDQISVYVTSADKCTYYFFGFAGPEQRPYLSQLCYVDDGNYPNRTICDSITVPNCSGDPLFWTGATGGSVRIQALWNADKNRCWVGFVDLGYAPRNFVEFAKCNLTSICTVSDFMKYWLKSTEMFDPNKCEECM